MKRTVRRVKNSDYWAQRFVLMNNALQNKSYDYVKNIEKQYNSAIADIDKQMRAWYQRFANNNAVSYADAQKMLTAGELKEFKWTVEEYISKAQENDLTGAWVKELENASARVHISRLEALKLQLRHQAEMLTGGRAAITHDAAKQAYIEGYYRTAYEVQRGLGYGWSMQALNTDALEKVLSRPWTVDDRTFTARCWTDKTKLVQTVNNELTRMLATGASPDKAIEAIVKQFNVSRYNAGRLIMTESAHFAVLAQHDGFKDLDVEEYQVVETFDKYTCSTCGDMDGKHFPMSDFAAGGNAPPFHPWCRGCVAPYFADMEGVGERYSRDPDSGKREMLPANTKFSEWRAKYVEQKNSEKGLTNGADGAIIREKNDSPITIINDAAIARVPNVAVLGYSEEQCAFIQQQHKDLLEYSRDHNDNNEVAFVFRKDLSDKTVFVGTDDRLEFGAELLGRGDGLFVMHNHPRNSSFSSNDLRFFLQYDSVKTFSIVKNNGEVELLIKTDSYDRAKAETLLERAYKKYVKQYSDAKINVAIEKFINKYKEGLLWTTMKKK